jgi:hypothetical protein
MSKLSLEQLGPTLFIGLGGAGGHVVARLNRFADETFKEDYDRLGHSRPLQFLLLDTDDFDKLDPEVRDSLGNRQQSFVSLSHFNPRRYAEKQLELHDTDLKRWFDRDTLPYLEDVTIHDGASRLRTLGRLCLHRHYETVEQRIREKVDAALDAGIHKESTRIRPEPPPLRIYLVASSCGGTGSAIFLDIAFMVNRIVRDRGWSPDLTGFVFLPFPYIEANSKLDPALKPFYEHNAWAFFEELNYFLAHPERVPDHALDPERRYHDRPRPLDQFGRDLMRTIYLVGNHIPSVGMLPLGHPLYDYTARGIFHTFLTPEEGAIQSHYSNIKSKLKDRDRKFGLVKRFAAFGYAEYRPSGDVVSRNVAELVHLEWQDLLGQRGGEEERERLASALLRTFGAELDGYLRRVNDWRPEFGLGGIAHNGADLSRIDPNAFPDMAHHQARKRRDEILLEALGAMGDSLARELKKRLEEPSSGVDMELAVLEKVREEVALRCQGLRAAQAGGDALSSEAIRKRVAELADEKPMPKNRLGFIKAQVDDEKRNAFVTGCHTAAEEIRKAFKGWLEGEVERGLGDVVNERVLPMLERRVQELRNLLAALKEHEPPRPVLRAEAVLAPVIQQVPPPRLLHQGGRHGDAVRLRARLGHVVQAELREAWKWAIPHLSAGGARVGEAAGAFRDRIAEIWRPRVSKGVQYRDVLEAVADWARRTGTAEAASGESASPSPREVETLLARLYPLSTPACPLDRTALDKSDSVPEIFAVVGPFTDDSEAQNKLSLPKPCSLIGNSNTDRIAVLQTWYAFSSRSLEGMETLRRSYLRRDRKQSLPHIDKSWNAQGLFQSTGTDDLSAHDEELVARLLALTPVLNGAGDALELGGRLRLQRDPRDQARMFLLTYRDSGYGHTFHWRDVRPREGFRGAWEVLQATHVSRNGKPDHAALTRDLLAELHVYLMSEVRERHDELLAAITEIERSGAGEYLIEAYRDYIKHLDAAIADEERRGRSKYSDLLRRLMERLDSYVRGLEHEDPAPLRAAGH